MNVYEEWVLCTKPGGTAEVDMIDFCPSKFTVTKVFFYSILNNSWKSNNER